MQIMFHLMYSCWLFLEMFKHCRKFIAELADKTIIIFVGGCNLSAVLFFRHKLPCYMHNSGNVIVRCSAVIRYARCKMTQFPRKKFHTNKRKWHSRCKTINAFYTLKPLVFSSISKISAEIVSCYKYKLHWALTLRSCRNYGSWLKV